MTMFPSDPEHRYTLAVVGAGPAGLAAAASAAESGATVAVLDGGSSVGGQFWRSAEVAERSFLHHGRQTFAGLVRRVQGSGVDLLCRRHVQAVVREGEQWILRCAQGSEPRAQSALTTVRASRLVLATGAYDRQLAFEGWDLPGVITAGGAQALLKGHGVLPGKRVVVAGTGPFLLPVADGLVRSGGTVVAVAEANSPLGFLRHLPAVAAAPAKLAEGTQYAARLALSRTPYRRRHAILRAVGGDQLEGVDLVRLDSTGHPLPGPARRLPCDVLAVGWGFTPQLELHLQAGCATEQGLDGSLVVAVDNEQRTTVTGVWAAGESTGVGGADLAIVEGEIAGRAAAGASIPDGLMQRRAKLGLFAAAMHAVHPVPDFLDGPPRDTVLCRCEEVAAGAVRDAVDKWGATDARSAKMFTRVGMGWCQGRICGYAAARVVARSCGRPVAIGDLRAFAERPFAVPLPLGTLVADD